LTGKEIKNGIRVKNKWKNIVIYFYFSVGIYILALEPMKHQEKYLGRRVHRGLFKSSIGKYINADINGALNILRKVIGDNFIKTNRGIADTPIRMMNPYKYEFDKVALSNA